MQRHYIHGHLDNDALKYLDDFDRKMVRVDSSNHDEGIFAKQNFKKDDLVCYYGGPVRDIFKNKIILPHHTQEEK